MSLIISRIIQFVYKLNTYIEKNRSLKINQLVDERRKREREREREKMR